MKTGLRVTLGLVLTGTGVLCLLGGVYGDEPVVFLVGVLMAVAGLAVALDRVPNTGPLGAPLDINPATGLLMMRGGMIDTGGNPRGVRLDRD